VLSWLKRKGSKTAPAPSAGQRTADRALAHEDRKLREADGRSSEIMSAVRELRALGVQNDFAGKVRRAMGGTN
jgi:hypothetical protein